MTKNNCNTPKPEGPFPCRQTFAKETVQVQRRNQLKVKIVEKFGSIAAFANHSEQTLQPWTIIRVLNGEKKKDVLKLLNKIERSLNRIKSDERRITETQRKKARRIILIELGSAAEFNRLFPRFKRPFISKVLNGKKAFRDKRTIDFFLEIAKLEDSQN